MIKIKNQGYISLHVTEINELYFTSFHVTFHVFHVISCCISRHSMLYFTSFHVTFHVISCRILHISLYALHTSHTCHACRAFCISHTVRISCIAPHITSFYVSFHVILSWKFILYSFMSFSIEERRKRVKMPSSSIERHLSGVFYSRG